MTMELPTTSTNEHVDTLLRHSVAQYLHAMFNNNESITLNKNTFDEFILLIKYQLDDMLIQLNKLTLLQRRQHVAKDDLKLWLQQYTLNTDEMDFSLQLNNFLRKRIRRDDTIDTSNNSNTDNSDSLSKSDTLMDTLKTIQEQNLISQNLKINNLNNTKLNHIMNELKIFPNLPPDHTFKFTSQFNSIVTDERIIRQNLINESRKTGTALSNLLSVNNKREETAKRTDIEADELSIAQKEIIALFGPQDDILSKTIAKLEKNELNDDFDTMQFLNDDDGDDDRKDKEKEKENEKNSNDFSLYYNKRFNVVEYSMNRIKLARKMVKNYELNKIRRNYNPFINTSKKILDSMKENGKEFTDQDRMNLLRQSFNQFIEYTGKMKIAKNKIIKDALRLRETRMKKLKEQLKYNEKNNIQSKQVNSDNFDIIDDTIDDDNLLFDELHSSDEDDELINTEPNKNDTKSNNEADDQIETDQLSHSIVHSDAPLPQEGNTGVVEHIETPDFNTRETTNLPNDLSEATSTEV